jgi:hypothetical protein
MVMTAAHDAVHRLGCGHYAFVRDDRAPCPTCFEMGGLKRENARLKNEVSSLNPEANYEVVKLRHDVEVLRSENARLQQTILEQQRMILNLQQGG